MCFNIPKLTGELNTHFSFRKIQGIALSESLFTEQTIVAHIAKKKLQNFHKLIYKDQPLIFV
jgi:hypothetical protein